MKFELNYYICILYSYISKQCPRILDEMLSNKRSKDSVFFVEKKVDALSYFESLCHKSNT